jgi:peptide deformylase
MIRKIITWPHPTLLKMAAPVEVVDDGIRMLLSDMVETMYVADGVGLAAPQVGESVRVIVLDVGNATDGRDKGLLKMVNPEILSCDGEITWEEGCLSVPDLRVNMKRSRSITARYLDENGAPHEIAAEGLLAVAIQHEIDHLDGKLIIDAVSRLKRELYLKKRKKLEAEEASVL